MKNEATEKQELENAQKLMEPELKFMVTTVPKAGKAIGLGMSASYAAAKRGEIPTIRIGRKLLVPLRRFREMME